MSPYLNTGHYISACITVNVHNPHYTLKGIRCSTFLLFLEFFKRLHSELIKPKQYWLNHATFHGINEMLVNIVEQSAPEDAIISIKS